MENKSKIQKQWMTALVVALLAITMLFAVACNNDKNKEDTEGSSGKALFENATEWKQSMDKAVAMRVAADRNFEDNFAALSLTADLPPQAFFDVKLNTKVKGNRSALSVDASVLGGFVTTKAEAFAQVDGYKGVFFDRLEGDADWTQTNSDLFAEGSNLPDQGSLAYNQAVYSFLTQGGGINAYKQVARLSQADAKLDVGAPLDFNFVLTVLSGHFDWFAWKADDSLSLGGVYEVLPEKANDLMQLFAGDAPVESPMITDAGLQVTFVKAGGILVPNGVSVSATQVTDVLGESLTLLNIQEYSVAYGQVGDIVLPGVDGQAPFANEQEWQQALQSAIDKRLAPDRNFAEMSWRDYLIDGQSQDRVEARFAVNANKSQIDASVSNDVETQTATAFASIEGTSAHAVYKQNDDIDWTATDFDLFGDTTTPPAEGSAEYNQRVYDVLMGAGPGWSKNGQKADLRADGTPVRVIPDFNDTLGQFFMNHFDWFAWSADKDNGGDLYTILPEKVVDFLTEFTGSQVPEDVQLSNVNIAIGFSKVGDEILPSNIVIEFASEEGLDLETPVTYAFSLGCSVEYGKVGE
ncbi:MAG: hypothetical protein FWD76_02195, partial [Firmicutes bacterium]|nr:hypothetical protein [Bacillota bacterium]